MSFPNEHACRLRDPSELEIVTSDERQHDDKSYRLFFGKPNDGGVSVEQAYRYPKESWTEEAARNHCKDHDRSFEGAEKTESFLRILTERADPDAKIFSWSMPVRYYMKPGRLIIFGITFTFTTGLTTAVNGIAAYYAPDANAPFPQPFWELLLSFAVAFIPVATVV